MFAACELAKILELPVTMIDMKPVVTATINGGRACFVADCGAGHRILTPASAAQFDLNTYSAPSDIRVVPKASAPRGIAP